MEVFIIIGLILLNGVWNLMAGLLICWFYGKKQALKKSIF